HRCYERINLIVPGDIDAPPCSNTSSAIEMGAHHYFVRAASGVNNDAGLSVVTVQTMVARIAMVLRANYPDNHVTTAIRGGDKGRTTAPVVPRSGPIGSDRGWVCRSNPESLKQATTHTKGNIRALLGPISHGC